MIHKLVHVNWDIPSPETDVEYAVKLGSTYRTMEQEKERLRRVLANELTPRQQQVLIAHYVEGKGVTSIAEELSLHKSTVCRTIKRGENRLRRYLQY